jgi:hypothetical protein
MLGESDRAEERNGGHEKGAVEKINLLASAKSFECSWEEHGYLRVRVSVEYLRDPAQR